ncbi:MAG: rod shape-determining protein [Victivallales bacterium]|nr:rod shape-determining protein [Victivallales bacterium]
MTVFSDDIGIDLGTMNTLVHVAGRGIVMEEPSVVALNKDTNKVIAVGKRAKDMLGRNPGNILTIRPMKDGVIADAEVADEMLRYFINKSRGHYKVMQPRVVIAVPYGINEVEVRAVQDSAKKAGAREVRLVPEPLASAIGVKLPVSDPTGSMIVDIGGGTSEVAIISLSSIVNAESVKCGGDAMDDAIREYMMKTHSLLIGERMAEDIKKTIGSAAPVENLQDSMEVKGRELGQHGNSLPREVMITAEEIRKALDPPINQIIAAIRRTLDKCKPELAGDLLNNGIRLAGGGSLLKGLAERIQTETNLFTLVAEDSLHAVINGLGELLKDPHVLFGQPQSTSVGNAYKQ